MRVIKTIELNNFIKEGWKFDDTLDNLNGEYAMVLKVCDKSIYTFSIGEITVEDYLRFVRSSGYLAVFYHGFIKNNILNVIEEINIPEEYINENDDELDKDITAIEKVLFGLPKE